MSSANVCEIRRSASPHLVRSVASAGIASETPFA